MRRAVAYLRLADSAEEPASRAAIASWADRERVTVAAWQVDVGVDGTTPIAERPGLLAAYRAIVSESADVLVAANAEHFSLDELVSWLIEQAALVQGAAVATADGSPVVRRRPAPSAERDEAYTRGILDLARAHYRVTVRARVRAALAAKRARGERVGNVPYGYRLAGDGVHLEPDEAEQAVIARVRSLSDEGLSQRAIVARLAEASVTGRTGAPLGQTQVAKILRVAS
jgi:DNA invertase Pin-like site-specific DNA recombinase